MKIREQTRKLAAGCSKHCFEVADGSWRGLNLIFEEYKSNSAFRIKGQVTL